MTAITEGGLTPSVGLVEAVVAAVPIPVNVIVRPHSRSFVYDADDLRVIERDVRAAVAAGANGVVFGALDARGDVDLGALARIAAAADGRALTFHRAFDVSRDLNAAFDALLRVPAVTSVLTSGGHPSVLDAVATITRLARQAAGSTCTVLAGSKYGRCGRRFRPRDRRARGAFRLGGAAARRGAGAGRSSTRRARARGDRQRGGTRVMHMAHGSGQRPLPYDADTTHRYAIRKGGSHDGRITRHAGRRR